MWTLEQGLKVVRALQPHTRQFGYHLTIGGGVVNNGESEKDLDLYFLPMGGFNKRLESKPDDMLAFLEQLWGKAETIRKEYEDDDDKEMLYKHAVKFSRKDKQRIDCFIF